MEEELLKSIDEKLGTMIKLLASNYIQGKSKTEAIIALGDLGIDVRTIAEMVDTTSATVSVRLSEHKKKLRQPPKRLKVR